MRIKSALRVLAMMTGRGPVPQPPIASYEFRDCPMLRRGPVKWGGGNVRGRSYLQMQWDVDTSIPGEVMGQRVEIAVIERYLVSQHGVVHQRGLVLWWGGLVGERHHVGQEMVLGPDAVVLVHNVGEDALWIPTQMEPSWRIQNYYCIMEVGFWVEWGKALIRFLERLGQMTYHTALPHNSLWGRNIHRIPGTVRLDMLLVARIVAGRLGTRWGASNPPMNRAGLGIGSCMGNEVVTCLH